MELHEAVKIVRKIANFSTYRWDEERQDDWVRQLVKWDRDLTLKAVETHILAKKLDSLSDLRDTYNGLAKRRQEQTPVLERGRADDGEIQRVKASIQAFLAQHPNVRRSYDRARDAKPA